MADDIQVGITGDDDLETPRDNSWEYALQKQNEDRAREQEMANLRQQRADADNNRRIYQGLVSMGDEMNNAMRQRRNVASASLLSAMKYAEMNGGTYPSYLLGNLNRGLNNDGENKAITGLGYDKKGNCLVRVAQRDPNTNQIVQKAVSYSPFDRYRMAMSTPGIYDRGEMEAMASNLTSKYGYRPDEVPQLPQGWGGESGGTAGGVTIPTLTRRRSSISAFGANGKGGFTQYESNEDTGYQLQSKDYGTRSADYKGEWRVLSKGPSEDSEIEVVTDENGNPVLNDKGEKVTRRIKGNPSQVTRYENSKTGEVVSVKDGETPPWERGTTSERERIAKINADSRIQAAKARNTIGGGTRGLSFEERMALEEQKNGRLAAQEEGRTARAKQNENMAKARLGASMGKTLKDLKLNLGLDDAQFEKLQSTLASTITNAFSQEQPSDKAEVKQGDNGSRERTAREIRVNPQNGDELPLKGGGKARYNGKTGKWEKVQ